VALFLISMLHSNLVELRLFFRRKERNHAMHGCSGIQKFLSYAKYYTITSNCACVDPKLG